MGTRPNLIKFINITGKDKIIWTGQHWDRELYKDLVEDLSIPTPDYDLGQTNLGGMVKKIVEIFKKEKPDCVIVYGDTRSALAGAIAAEEHGVKLAHIEAGLRCFDTSRPEENIRKMIDQVSDYLFCPTKTAVENLKKENIVKDVWLVGDVHYDRYVQYRKHGGYVLATIHRAEHTNSKEILEGIIKRLDGEEEVLFPMHPRTKKCLEKFKIELPRNVMALAPHPYTAMLHMIKNARLVITDSGGVSREAWFSGTPVEIVGLSEWPEINAFGDGRAGEKVKEILLKEVE